MISGLDEAALAAASIAQVHKVQLAMTDDDEDGGGGGRDPEGTTHQSKDEDRREEVLAMERASAAKAAAVARAKAEEEEQARAAAELAAGKAGLALLDGGGFSNHIENVDIEVPIFEPDATSEKKLRISGRLTISSLVDMEKTLYASKKKKAEDEGQTIAEEDEDEPNFNQYEADTPLLAEVMEEGDDEGFLDD